MKILLVEDSHDKRDNIAELLKKSHNPTTIHIEESVRGAIEQIDSNEVFDLILLDMSLPLFDITDEY